MHVPCSHDARAEVKELMMVSNNIVSPQSNRPVMGIVQDSLLACSKLTRRDVFLTKEDFTNIMFRLGKSDATELPVPCILKPVPLWSGKQLFSLVMPKKTYMTLNRFAAQYDDADQQEKRGFSFTDSEVIIRNGELLSGILCKKALGTSSGGLIHKTWTEGSPTAACDLISNIQFMSNMWLVDNGFSVGIKDCVNANDVQERVDGIVTECIRDAHRTIDQALEQKRAPATYEHSMNNILNRARDSSGRYVQQQMTASNNLYSMVTGGSKGSVINIAQIMACVGQQNVNGNRIDYGYVNRTLPHFKKYDNTPESRGFVKHSYMQGLTPAEFYFHAMGGREGVIDTAIKTSETGYTQRRLVKAMEDIRVDFDGTVRNSIGDILQFKYGEDNMDGSKLIAQNLGDAKVYLPLHVADFLANNVDMVFGRFEKENPDLTPVFNDVLRAHDVSSYDPYILHRTQNATITPGEMVGIIAAQSLGQPITQMTLNSVEYNTEIMVSENGKLKEYRIGDWIESRIANGDKSTHQYIEKGDQIYAPISKDEDVRILSSDEDGNVFWDHVDAVTRHLPINEDGSNTLIRVTTLSGHECTVTKGESVLTRQNNKLLKSKGSDLKIGDYLPAMSTLPMLEEHRIQDLDVREYVPKNEFIYTSEVEKALAVYTASKKKSSWWTSNKGTRFELPYSRSDSFIDYLLYHKIGNKPNCVYPKNAVIQPCHFPERLVLDELFGFVIGAYLAEGCVTKHHVLISNNNHTFTNKIEQWADLIGAKYHYDEGTKPKGYSRTIRIHSIVLARLFNEMFNDVPIPVKDEEIDACVEYDIHAESKASSRTKHLPVSLLGAPDECLRGIVDGYFCGGGSVATKQKYITADSVSRKLLENMSLVLRKFDVKASIAIKNGYTLSLNKRNSEQFARRFTLTLKHKQNRLDDYLTNTNRDTKDSLCDEVPNVCLSNGTTNNMTIKDLVTMANDDNAPEEDRTVCRTILDAGIHYDRVVKVEEVRSNHTHVFDMTTRISRNFTDKRLVLNDTFHSAGISTMNVTLGVPRLKELINVSKNIKSPCMKIKYKDPALEHELCGVFLKRFVTKTEIMHKYPSPDFELEYMELMDIDSLGESIEDTEWSISYTVNVNELEASGLDLLTVTLWLNKTFNHIWCSCSASSDVILIRLFSSNNGLDTYSKIKQLSNKLLYEVNIKGYKNVTKCVMNGEYIETMGIDLDNVLTNEGVDPYGTSCNDVITAYNVLGIEAARAVLLNEITKVIEFDGSYVDYRHISMLIDTMTYKGNLMAITRHGINRTETGVLMRCSFEETVNIITDAATYAEYDAMKGVTEHIIMGKTAKVGTGTIDVMVDMEKLMNMNMELEPESYYDEFVPSTPTRHDDEFEDTFFPLKE